MFMLPCVLLAGWRLFFISRLFVVHLANAGLWIMSYNLSAGIIVQVLRACFRRFDGEVVVCCFFLFLHAGRNICSFFAHHVPLCHAA